MKAKEADACAENVCGGPFPPGARHGPCERTATSRGSGGHGPGTRLARRTSRAARRGLERGREGDRGGGDAGSIPPRASRAPLSPSFPAARRSSAAGSSPAERHRRRACGRAPAGRGRGQRGAPTRPGHGRGRRAGSSRRWPAGGVGASAPHGGLAASLGAQGRGRAEDPDRAGFLGASLKGSWCSAARLRQCFHTCHQRGAARRRRRLSGLRGWGSVPPGWLALLDSIIATGLEGGALLFSPRRAAQSLGKFPTWATKADEPRLLAGADPKVPEVSPASCALGCPSSHPQTHIPSLAEGNRGRLRTGPAGPSAGGPGSPGNPLPAPRPGARPLPSPRAAPAYPLAGALRPQPRGPAHPTASLEKENESYVPRGTEFASSQGTEGDFIRPRGSADTPRGVGGARANSDFGVDLILWHLQLRSPRPLVTQEVQLSFAW
ncbi:collagen alpha-1(I) chain-like [Equus przewalskii]|uniref:Collagen alpha-1(I) chain-like n=1 Tax=Equus przewalskii TaxID=9798 RepID=A0ABM4KII5_EQUPR